MCFIMRHKPFEDDILAYCHEPRTINDLCVKFKIFSSFAFRVMAKLLKKKRVIVAKRVMNGALKNVYIIPEQVDSSDLYKKIYHVYTTYDLPAHDPFGLAKGGANAR